MPRDLIPQFPERWRGRLGRWPYSVHSGCVICVKKDNVAFFSSPVSRVLLVTSPLGLGVYDVTTSALALVVS